MEFTTDYQQILQKVEEVEPIEYGKTRNFIDGAVTKLSPYISRGVISTKYVFEQTLNRGFDVKEIERFVQELAWRDYWQQVWIAKGNAINQDLRQPQQDVSNEKLPSAIIQANTSIDAIDTGIQDLYEIGYMHNHVRMYTASVACNVAKSHWYLPAKWMYYHLLDGDWASNALSWQWVAGANAGKKYVANQENINKYCYSDQKDTFLDVPYEQLPPKDVPDDLKELFLPELSTNLPTSDNLKLDKNLPTYIFNWYNLDPQWAPETGCNKILVLEPSVFKQYPIADKSIDFMMQLGKNIQNLQIFTGEFSDLVNQFELEDIHFKEHPLNANYKGTVHPRDWMFKVTGYFPSFFAFWKKCKKELS